MEGIQSALELFGGAVRRVIFDNAKVAVKEGYGKKPLCVWTDIQPLWLRYRFLQPNLW